MIFICKILFCMTFRCSPRDLPGTHKNRTKCDEEEGWMNNGNHFKYWCKQAKICVWKFTINALISLAKRLHWKWRFDFKQITEKNSFSYTKSKQFPFIGQMFLHSWISAASSRWNLFKLNNFFYYFHEWVSYRVFTYHHHHRFCAREWTKISRNFMRKKNKNIIKYIEMKWEKIPFNKSKTNKTIGIFVQK